MEHGLVVEFSIRVDGEKHAAATLDGIAAKADNIRPALEEIYLAFLDIERELFENEGAYGGQSKWKRIDPFYRAWKVKRGLSPEILRMRDDLFYAMTVYRSRHATVSIRQSTITVTPINKIYRLHMTGYSTKGGMVPARPWVHLTERDRELFVKEISRHLMREKRGTTVKPRFL